MFFLLSPSPSLSLSLSVSPASLFFSSALFSFVVLTPLSWSKQQKKQHKRRDNRPCLKCLVVVRCLCLNAYKRLAALVLLPLCPVLVLLGTRVYLCAVCACARLCSICGGGPLYFYAGCSRCLARAQLSSFLPLSILWFVVPMVPKVRGERRAAERADREAAERRARQRLEEVETRFDGAESLGRNHDQRISFQESPQRIVLRGFSCVGEFAGACGGDFQLVKRAFIGFFFQELKEHCGAEVTHHFWKYPKGTLQKGTLRIYLNFT